MPSVRIIQIDRDRVEDFQDACAATEAQLRKERELAVKAEADQQELASKPAEICPVHTPFSSSFQSEG